MLMRKLAIRHSSFVSEVRPGVPHAPTQGAGTFPGGKQHSPVGTFFTEMNLLYLRFHSDMLVMRTHDFIKISNFTVCWQTVKYFLKLFSTTVHVFYIFLYLNNQIYYFYLAAFLKNILHARFGGFALIRE